MDIDIIIEFTTFYLLFWWVMSILYKDNFILNRLESLGHWFNKKEIRVNILMVVFLTIQLALTTVTIGFDLGFIYGVACIVLLPIIIMSRNVGNIFLGISECKFCIENHIATIGAIAYSYYWLDYKYLIWGLLCASINSWIRTFIE